MAILWLWVSAALVATGLFVVGLAAAQQTPGVGPVYVVVVGGEIDLGVAPYLRRVLRTAAEQDASAVVVELDTPGGRLDAALEMRDALLNAEVPTIAYVDRQAYSAGALIAIATERIYMAPGAVMGAATPIIGGTGETADEKTISAVRSAFRATAEATGRDPRIAEAMVDPRVEVPGLDGPDELLTFTTQEALTWGYAVAVAPTLEAVLADAGLAEREVIRTSPGVAETVVRFITNPIVASLLISLGFLGLLFELQSPGFGVGGTVAVLALATFFWGHLLAGLAGWEGIALVGAGIVLLLVEVLVIPGFGVAGVLGVIAFLSGIYLSLVGRLPTTGDYLEAALVVMASLILLIIGGYLVLRFLPKRAMGGIILTTRLQALLGTAGGGEAASVGGAPMTSQDVPASVGLAWVSLVGARGRAVTDLHPAGTALFGRSRIDVVAEEGFLPAGTPVEVVVDEEYRRVVRRLDDAE